MYAGLRFVESAGEKGVVLPAFGGVDEVTEEDLSQISGGAPETMGRLCGE